MWSGLPSEALIYMGLPLVFFNRLALGSGPTPLPCLRVGLAPLLVAHRFPWWLWLLHSFLASTSEVLHLHRPFLPWQLTPLLLCG